MHVCVSLPFADSPDVGERRVMVPSFVGLSTYCNGLSGYSWLHSRSYGAGTGPRQIIKHDHPVRTSPSMYMQHNISQISYSRRD